LRLVWIVQGPRRRSPRVCPATDHRFLGFTVGEIPTAKVNRPLLRNISVLGAGWGEYVRTNPGYTSRQWAALSPLLESRALRITEPTVYSFKHAADALRALETRSATGKIALSVLPY
jgi:NADPH2:quinone reductase